MEIKAVIFDLDGVLVTTDELHYRAWKALADREGIYFDMEINKRLRGVSRMASVEIILERSNRGYSDEEKLEMTEFKNRLYVSYLDALDESSLLPGARETLESLREMGLKVGVGSSSKNAEKILRKTGLYPLLDALADGRDVSRSKPAPDVFLRAAEKLGAAPADCVVVEDAVAGIEAAMAAGMYAVAIGDAVGSPPADTAIKSLAELLEIVKD